MAMSDRVAVMRDGRIVQCRTALDIFDRPRTRLVADFVREAVRDDSPLPVSNAAAYGSVGGVRAVRVLLQQNDIYPN